MTSSSDISWAEFLSTGTIDTSVPFDVFFDPTESKWVLTKPSVNSCGALHVLPSFTSNKRPQTVNKWAMFGTAIINDGSSQGLQNDVDDFRTAVQQVTASFNVTGKGTGWHSAGTVALTHDPVQCTVTQRNGTKTDVAKFSLTLTPYVYVP